MKNISIDELRHNIGSSFCYADDCLFVSESLQYLCTLEPVRLNFSLMVLCTSGSISWEQNGQQYTLYQNDFGIILSGISLAKVSISTDCKIKSVGLSDRFLQRMFHCGTDAWRVARFLKSNPMKHVDGRNSELLSHYIDLISIELSIGDIVHREEITQHLFAALILEMMSDINRYIVTSYENEKISSSSYIFQRFLKELYADNGYHRSVIYYAEKLCCSPTYLSRLIKKHSGKKALSLINEYAVERIALELEYSEKSIKEIAMEFDFPNISFFAKYIRKHLKLSPAEFRNKTR